MKIAPTLQAIVKAGEAKYGPQCNPLPRAELRALLAVARAANDLVTTTAPTTEHARRKVSAIERALARLEKVSKP